MHTISHPQGGTTIFGWLVPPGEVIMMNDQYSSTDGDWHKAGCFAGLRLEPGTSTIWVRTERRELSRDARTLLGYLCRMVWGPNSCIGEFGGNHYVIPGPSFNWDGRIGWQSHRVRHSRCVQELVELGYLAREGYTILSPSSDYAPAGLDGANIVYVLTDDGREEGQRIHAADN